MIRSIAGVPSTGQTGGLRGAASEGESRYSELLGRGICGMFEVLNDL